MSWHISTRMVESCNCTMLCPCWYGVEELMVFDQDTCATPFLFLIDEGQSEGVDLSGCTLVMTSVFPGPTLFDGDATSRLYMDNDTSEDQQRELEAIFKGEKGGPMEIIGGLVSEWLPTEITNIDVQENGDTLVATVGEFGKIESSLLKNEAEQQMIMKNVGFTAALQFKDQTGMLAPSNSRWSDDALPHSFETNSGVRGYAQWSSN